MGLDGYKQKLTYCGDRIMCASSSGSVHTWDKRTFDSWVLPVTTGIAVNCVYRAGNRLITCCADGKMHIFETVW
jgi:WD40 repeat protein